MEQEKQDQELLDLIEPSPVQTVTEDDISEADQLKDGVIDDLASIPIETHAAIIDRQKSPEELLAEETQTLNARFKSGELSGQEVETLLQQAINNIRRYKSESKTEEIALAIYGRLLALMSPILAATSNAGIPNEKHVVQGLKQEYRPTLLDTNSALEYYKRHHDYRDELNNTLARAGFEDSDIEKMVSLTEAVPGAQDVVSFMVREVYNSRIVEQFRQEEGFDELYREAKQDADRAGIPEETLRKYWAAHWRLPGIVQGFEMLHRGEIDVDGLRRLLKASDIMPGFIEPLINISYRPFTRVDVRRMHKIGVLTDEQTKQAYKDLGYDDDKAAKMLEFTRLYNEHGLNLLEEDKIKERDLTKAEILRAYKMELYVRNEAERALKTLGYDDDESEMMLDRIDWEQQREIIDDYIKNYRRAYVTRLWDERETRQKLNELQLPATYIQFLMETWDIQRQIKDKQPSKGELLGWYKKGIITEFTARAELANLGYADKYVNWYIQSVRPKQEAT